MQDLNNRVGTSRGVSLEKSICGLQDILWRESGLSNLFYEYFQFLGLDLFFFKLFAVGFSEEKFPILEML